jgi:hypothetical protein
VSYPSFVSCACDHFSKDRLAISKVDPLQVLDDLIPVENVEIEARHAWETARLNGKLWPYLEDAALQLVPWRSDYDGLLGGSGAAAGATVRMFFG